MSYWLIGFFSLFLYFSAAWAQEEPASPGESPAAPKKVVLTPKTKKLQSDAEALLKDKKYDKALDLLKGQIENLDREGLNLLSKAYEGKKDWINQIRFLNMVVGQNPKDIRALTKIGDAYFNSNQTPSAITNYKLALEINPKYLPALQGLANSLKKSGNNYELLTLYQEMNEIWGPKTEYIRELCRLNVEEGYFDAAAKLCATAVEKDPLFPDNHVYWALYLKDAGNDKQANKVLEKASQSFPKSELVQRIYGSLLEDQKNYIQGYKCFAKAAEADPKSYKAQLGLARNAYELQKYEVSLGAFQKACKLDRRALQDFRTVASKLRNAHQTDWVKKFDYAIEKCGL